MSSYDLVMVNREYIRELFKEINCTDPKLFGSTARKEDTELSDIDILYTPLKGVSYFKIAEIERRLTSAFGKRVELVDMTHLKELFKPYILKEAIDI